MSAERKIRIKILTSWILTAFSVFVPIWTGARMGAVLFESSIELIQPLPLNKFSPTSENSSPFFPYIRHTIYDLLLLLGAVPKNAYFSPPPTRFSPPVTRFCPPLARFSPPLTSFSPHSSSFCPLTARFRPHLAKGCRGVKWQVSRWQGVLVPRPRGGPLSSGLTRVFPGSTVNFFMVRAAAFFLN
jgi:hypothetical protein